MNKDKLHKCEYCGNETKNKKFCSIRCNSKYNKANKIGLFSLASVAKAHKTMKKNKVGFYDTKMKIEAGKIGGKAAAITNRKNKTSYFFDKRLQIKGRLTMKQNNLGFFGMTNEQCVLAGKLASEFSRTNKIGRFNSVLQSELAKRPRKNPVSDKAKRNMSIAHVKYLMSSKNTFSKKFEYSSTYFRSNWEIIVAKWLDDNNIVWEYESENCVHVLSDGHRYIIDFYLSELDCYIEVKGWWDKRSVYKFEDASKTKDIRIVDERNLDDISLKLNRLPILK